MQEKEREAKMKIRKIVQSLKDRQVRQYTGWSLAIVYVETTCTLEEEILLNLTE